MINDLEFSQPRKLSEALEILAGSGRIVPVAGGTNVLVNMKRAPLEADRVVDLNRLDALRAIDAANGAIHIGAGVTFAQILEWRPGGAVQGLLEPMARAFAGPLIRNLASMGGNICDASPAADVSPPLLALDARVRLESAGAGACSMPLEEFFLGPRKTARRPDELLTRIEFPRPHPGTRWFYYKLGKRRADAISIVSVAMALRVEDGKARDVRIALGAVAPVAMRARRAESILEGQELGEGTMATVAAASRDEARPIDDFRASADYRREMIEVLVRRGLRKMASWG